MMEICANPNESRVPTLEWASEVVSRYPIIFGAEGSQMFGWIHTRVESVAGAGVLICSPIGIEYIQSHRSVRHLADQLAEAGFPTMRFDYPGCGDSAQTEFDDDRVATWVKSIEIAATTLRERTGCSKVALVGIRFGASLASLAASRVGAEWLVLWNPVINGRHYVREMRALAMAARHRAVQESDLLEVAGFAYTPQTVLDIAAIDLLSLEFPTLSEALILERDDLASDSANFTSNLDRQGVRHEVVRVPGYANMMTEAQYSEVPWKALDVIVAWFKCATGHGFRQRGVVPNGLVVPLRLRGIYEEPLRLGLSEQLFGVICRPDIQVGLEQPIIVFLNPGSVHHVGSGQLYVKLARAIALDGFTSFRFDLAALGDSAAGKQVYENHPYPPSAVNDLLVVLDGLKRGLHRSKFILVGLCSGAYHAFRAAIEQDNREIVEVILINPLTFRWVEGATLATGEHFMEAVRYRRSISTFKTWGKFLRMEMDLRRIAPVIFRHMFLVTRSYVIWLAERLGLSAGGVVSQDLRKLYKLGTRMVLFIASRDPGLDILMAEARHAARVAIRRGSILVYSIPDADHTFSSYEARCRLIEQMRVHLHSFKLEK